MSMERFPKVLILSAGYGDGHHAAARGLVEAFQGKAETRMVDLCAEAMPKTFKYTRMGYLWVISRMPGIWKMMYDASDRIDMSEKPIKGLGPVEDLLETILDDWKPDLIISTYMLYPYMLDQLSVKRGYCIPYITVVTDSIVINKSWTCSQSPLWAVADQWTKQVMIDKGVPAERIAVTGFPVPPYLAKLRQENPKQWKDGEDFEVLYFAQRSPQLAKQEIIQILEAHPNVKVTCILGRKFRNIYPSILALKKQYQGRLIIRGWTRQVPKYLAKAHLVVGKAGGATTHEVLAVGRPLLVNFLLPGQEEGNLQLLEHFGGGLHVPTPEQLGHTISDLLKENGKAWKKMYQAILNANMTGGGEKIVDLALKH